MVVWGQVKSESRWLPVTVRVSKTRVLKFSNATTTATATKTSLKKWIRAASNFIALFPSRLIRQMLANFFSELNSKGLHQSSGKEKESCCLLLPSSPKREIRQNHVVVVQRRQRTVQKKRDARAKLLFCFYVKLSTFCHCRKQTEFHLLKLGLKTGNWSADNFKNTSPHWVVYLSPGYSHVTPVSRYFFTQLSIDHNMDVQYQVKHR